MVSKNVEKCQGVLQARPGDERDARERGRDPEGFGRDICLGHEEVRPQPHRQELCGGGFSNIIFAQNVFFFILKSSETYAQKMFLNSEKKNLRPNFFSIQNFIFSS